MGKRKLELGVPGSRRRGGPKRRWMDVIREDMEKAGVGEGEVEDRRVRRVKARCGDPE